MNSAKHKPSFVVWFTGLSASGKTTIAQSVRLRLAERGCDAHHLDGDEVRAASPVKLGFSREDRDANIRLAVALAKRHQSAGRVVIASFISPYRSHREHARSELINFIEVFVDAPVAVCEARDPKGLYQKARAGEIQSFTGISDPYEPPFAPHIHLKTDADSAEQCAERVIAFLIQQGLIAA